MPNLLFWLVALGVMVWLGRRRRPPLDRDAPETIQSYRLLEGGALLLPPVTVNPTLRWRVLSLEELPTQHRRRMILHIAVDPPLPPRASLERLLWSLAAGIQRRARAHAVVVEAFDAAAAQPTAGAGAARLLLSLDGHGWSGQDPLIACMEAHGAPPQTFSLGQVQRMIGAAHTPQAPSAPTLDASPAPS